MLPRAAGPWCRHATNAAGGHSGLGPSPWLSVPLVTGSSGPWSLLSIVRHLVSTRADSGVDCSRAHGLALESVQLAPCFSCMGRPEAHARPWCWSRARSCSF